MGGDQSSKHVGRHQRSDEVSVGQANALNLVHGVVSGRNCRAMHPPSSRPTASKAISRYLAENTKASVTSPADCVAFLMSSPLSTEFVSLGL
jgi:hypothetical protein